MTTSTKLRELTAAKDPTRELLERLGYEYLRTEVPSAKREGRRVRVPAATGDRHGQT